ncbi:MAG: 2-C-methyl-D-erythritol 2,4-cyclodiphosphate synthase [bacterium]|nr:MAG: 2-C-methyl-D-erythritol 2,4-cyclodiphosphate synthase [bacterium]
MKIDYDKGLKGYSDGDAVIHSVIDSILSAAHLGNIGMLFPDSDKKYKNIKSTILLERTSDIIKKGGYAIINISAVIIAQEPRLYGYLNEMEQIMAKILDLDKHDISIAAKTNDTMGFIGRKEGIAAHSVCLMRKSSSSAKNESR